MSAAILSFPDLASRGLTWADIAHMKETAELVAQLRRDRAIPSLAKGYLEFIIGELIEMVDELDGDCDLEDGDDLEIVCEDEGAQCDDEGVDSDREPDCDAESSRLIPGGGCA